MEADITDAEQLTIVVSNYDDGFAYDRADLINPVLIDEEGNETSLTTLSPASYTSEWGTLHVNRNVENGTLRVDGKTYTTGLGLNAECKLIYDLPKGHHFKTFRTLCGYDSSCDTDNKSSSGTTMEFFVYVTRSNSYSFDLTKLGYDAEEEVPVYDIWAQENLGNATGSLSAEIPNHGVKLYRLGDKEPVGINQVRTTPASQAITPKSKDKNIYDLQGRRIKKPGKGFFIQGGVTFLSR